MCVCVCECVYACVIACVRASVRACVRACARGCVCNICELCLSTVGRYLDFRAWSLNELSGYFVKKVIKSLKLWFSWHSVPKVVDATNGCSRPKPLEKEKNSFLSFSYNLFCAVVTGTLLLSNQRSTIVLPPTGSPLTLLKHWCHISVMENTYVGITLIRVFLC